MRRNWSWNVPRSCFWDRDWWRAGQLLANFSLSLVTIPEVFAWVNSAQFLLVSKVVNVSIFLPVCCFHKWRSRGHWDRVCPWVPSYGRCGRTPITHLKLISTETEVLMIYEINCVHCDDHFFIFRSRSQSVTLLKRKFPERCRLQKHSILSVVCSPVWQSWRESVVFITVKQLRWVGHLWMFLTRFYVFQGFCLT